MPASASPLRAGDALASSAFRLSKVYDFVADG